MGLVPITYPLWSWDIGNVTATPEQTKAAYLSATTNGLTTDFHRNVWNDIVDVLNQLLFAAGREWDNKYTSMDDAKVHEPNGLLTAKMFNSVRHNIENAAFTTWKWEFDPSLPGYVGRNDFRGVNDVGSKTADIVYGWYIIELARKLNVLIELFRGTADVLECSYLHKSFTEYETKFTALKIVRLNPENKVSRTCLETYMKVIQLVKLQFSGESKTELVFLFSVDPSISLLGEFCSLTRNIAKANVDNSLPVVGDINSETKLESIMFPRDGVLLYSGSLSEILSEIDTAIVKTLKVTLYDISTSESVTGMIIAKGYQWLFYYDGSDSYVSSMIKNIPINPVHASEAGFHKVESFLNNDRPTPIVISEISGSESGISLTDLPPTAIMIFENSSNIVNAIITSTDVSAISTWMSSLSASSKKMINSPPSVLSINESSCSDNRTRLGKIYVMRIKCAATAECEAKTRFVIWYKVIQRDNDLYIRSTYANAVQDSRYLHIT